MKLIYLLVIAAIAWGCRTASSGAGSQVLDDEDGIPLWQEDAVLGATEDHIGSVRTRIVLEEGYTPISQTFSGGSEYWLYTYGGRGTGMITYSDAGNYRPYTGNADCDRCEAGEIGKCRFVCGEATNSCERPVSNQSWCELRPSEMARRCMRQASNTLDAIRNSGNMPDTGGLGFFGWINDGAAIDGASASGRIWVYHESLIKWVGSVDSDGVCETPSLYNLKNLLDSRR